MKVSFSAIFLKYRVSTNATTVPEEITIPKIMTHLSRKFWFSYTKLTFTIMFSEYIYILIDITIASTFLHFHFHF